VDFGIFGESLKREKEIRVNVNEKVRKKQKIK
jgi:hypothetical protein